ncbi:MULTISPECIES: rod shape-determining protein MreD [Proteiniphilum]|jgi:rod shape-determining protein MreD|uniref:rod shape-determining protein MreD n=1 Tax=Proteiniphilum TaxID=294702 RepID=UPI001EEBFEFA|nr:MULTISPECIES: rod shape-determining protein MreD [Proteiniphilum]MDD2245874.1 rod shape-determining protein MreD [Proteiniphilum sp.]MDD3909271.1 rod shape-determining protein MreD [Proteiniphilum sp.]MDD4416013.1 rod shape-determining protein MreD [Proteiniphilum sp.]ULB33326.1 rod shape-determining protein MreD [Proteiniphilum propionicum]
MKVRTIYEIVLFVMLILLQVLLLNRISLFGITTPVLYIYFLLKLPMGRNKFFVIISGFLLGLIIDIFLNTPGINAAATTIVAAFRKNIMDLFFEKEEYDEFVPGIYTTAGPFIRFTVFMVLLHLSLIFLIESFTLFNLAGTLLRILSSSVASILLIIALDSLMFRKRPGEQS